MLETKITELVEAINNNTAGMYELAQALKIRGDEVLDSVVSSIPGSSTSNEKKVGGAKKVKATEKAKKKKTEVEATKELSGDFTFEDIKELATDGFNLCVGNRDKLDTFLDVVHKYTKNKSVDIKLIPKKEYGSFVKEIKTVVEEQK